ncbi:MAG: 23S rRNA (uracil(1939)-C(5))-methyltransferase RlmD [Eubacteriaceae bacterium]|nr:23S rRNA (uracil(1939)-C(5))-methyltransferase RlmD [Eubacteriaceae bacterium]
MFKKGEIIEATIKELKFPNKGIAYIEDSRVFVKNVIPGQKISLRIGKKRKNKIEGNLLEIVEKAPNEINALCPVFGLCGGCTYQNLSYPDQLKLKEGFVKEILSDYNIDDVYEGIIPSPQHFEYRNKMEFSFGDEFKDGPLTLGLHKRGSMYDIVNAGSCVLVDEDFRKVLNSVLEYVKGKGLSYYHKRTHEGFLRHLVVRKGIRTSQLLIELVTSSQGTLDEKEFAGALMALPLKAALQGIIHTINDSLADVVQEDKSAILMGKDHFYEEISGLKFKITPRSFFQTNSEGAEKLYQVVSDYAKSPSRGHIFDLYCGTGTITQIMSKEYDSVTGIDIVPDAIEAAKQNAALNGLHNIDFICGDVMNEIEKLTEKPSVIVLDPPRDGIHVKAIDKIINFKPDIFVYVSCKITSLARDLEHFIQAGYAIERVKCVDMYPNTPHLETVVMLKK